MGTHGISVALCTYNGERFLRKQLDSIAAQTCPPTELIVRDDQSSDRTLDILQDFRKEAAFPVQISSNGQRLGIARNFDSAIAGCGEEIIALADQDDIWLPEKLEIISAVFQSRPKAAAVFSDAELITEDGHPTGTPLSQAQGYASGPVAARLHDGRVLEVLFARNICTGATMAFRRELRDLVLPLPSPMPNNMLHDAWIALAAALHDRLTYIRQPLILYRQHGQQQLGATIAARPPFLTRAKWSREERQRYLVEEAGKAGVLYQAVSERLPDAPGRSPLKEYAQFLKKRSALPERRAARVRPVLGHLLAGNYRRYAAAGILTALRDLSA